MAWIIDKDYLADADAQPGTNCNAVDIMGPSSYRGDGKKLKHRFRMLDDDRTLYYTDRCDSCDDENAFDPLDDFDGPNAGCTIIQYRNPLTRKWEDL